MNPKQILPSVLVAFDFDHTICRDNTDIEIKRLLPPDQIPEYTKHFDQTDGWTGYMAKIFELLHIHQVDSKEIMNVISNIPPVSGVPDLMLELHSRNCEIIIISDSNSFFIETWLTSHKLMHTVSKIYTNPAEFDQQGMLKIKMYHLQDWCNLSEKNMCKGYILESHIQERKLQGVEFSTIAYIGDGSNDLCPMLKLGKKDFGFPKFGHKLIKLLKEPKYEDKIVCDIVPWETGDDIIQSFREKIFFD